MEECTVTSSYDPEYQGGSTILTRRRGQTLVVFCLASRPLNCTVKNSVKSCRYISYEYSDCRKILKNKVKLLSLPTVVT